MEAGEHRTHLGNIARFLLRNPRSLTTLFRKVVKRFRDGHGRYDPAANDAWIEEHSVEPANIARSLDAGLWDEAIEFAAATRKRAEPILADLHFEMGAGGDYQFLYWLTRYLKPNTIVETGVSAGWTSQAFLTAIAVNGHGKLKSSDFPYFRIKDPERFIGIVVDPALKPGWVLRTDGDERALPDLLREPVDIFHYDSDKSVSGRDFATKLAMEQLSPGGVLLMDDIRNDSWFREYVERVQLPFCVLQGRCGLIDPTGRLCGNISPAD